jgi:RNA polymerase sigma-70 factor (ECF subfamily)
VDYRSDAELVGLVLAGQTDAYSVLVRRYQDNFFRYATRVLGSREDADDALQSAFVRAFRSLSQCKDPSRFGAWLHRIVVNQCRTFGARRSRRERRVVRDEGELEKLAVEPASAVSPELEEVQRAVDQLPLEQREAFVLKYVEELSYEEMSRLLGVGESALKMRVKRACSRLRELIEQAGRVS